MKRSQLLPGFLFPVPLLFAPLAASAPQEESGVRAERDDVDPYTKGADKAMKKAGYVSFGPFLIGDSHTNEVAADVLGGVPLLWVETEHFRIGSSLEPYKPVDDVYEKKKLREELGRLKKIVPGVKTKAKELDPWLRLHLYAMRLEEFYDRFLETFGLEEDDFPSSPADPKAKSGAMGAGPYLGMKEKFSVLLLEKRSSLARYTETFLDKRIDSSYRFWFSKTDNMFFGITFDNLQGDYRTDTVLHWGLIFGMAKNFTNSCRGYTHEGPVWFSDGVARWFARPVEERCLLYTTTEDKGVRGEEDSDWEPKVRARVGHEVFPKMEEMLAWEDRNKLSFADHMMVWSRVDYFLRDKRETANKLLLAIAAPVPWETKEPREEVLKEHFRTALVEASGMELEELDAAWAKWVEKEYRKR